MAKQIDPIQVELVDQDDQHWQLQTVKGKTIGSITEENKRFLSYYGTETKPTRHKTLSEATQDLLMQYNLHQH